MRRSEYKAITTGRGAQIRAFFRQAADRHPTTDRAELVAQLDDMGVPEANRDAWIEAYRNARTELAGMGSQWERHQAADRVAVAAVIRTEKAADIDGRSATEDAARTEDQARADAERVATEMAKPTVGEQLAADIDSGRFGDSYDQRGRPSVRLS